MKIYTLTREQVIHRPLDEVFAFFAKPENLAKITPDTVGFVILTPTPISMQVGAVIDYTIKVFGLRRYWTTMISDYKPPHKFVDVQLKGPYEFWHHTHTFEACAEGTIVRDTVRYVLPFGWLGRLAHALVVKRQLRQIFDFRSKVIEDFFGDAGPGKRTIAAHDA